MVWCKNVGIVVLLMATTTLLGCNQLASDSPSVEAPKLEEDSSEQENSALDQETDVLLEEELTSPAPARRSEDAMFSPSFPGRTAAVNPALVTEQELAVRRRQVDAAKEYEALMSARIDAGVGTMIEVKMAELTIMEYEILLLQAERAFEDKQSGNEL